MISRDIYYYITHTHNYQPTAVTLSIASFIGRRYSQE